MSVRFRIKWMPRSAGIQAPFEWHLDLPDLQLTVDVSDAVQIKGWVSGEGAASVSLILKRGDETVVHELDSGYTNAAQDDVSRPEGQVCIRCHFSCGLEINEVPTAIGFRFQKQSYWLGHISFAQVPKVLVGRRGTLFLDNDTNQSIDQFQGRLAISAGEMDAWREYFEMLGRLSREHALRTALLVAPGKEYVHPEDYPYARGATTPVDQLLDAFESSHQIIFPLDAMTKDRDVTYSTDDTHWTDYGALLAAREICASFGDECFDSAPPFRLVMRVGDLGKKLAEPVQTPYFKADFSGTSSALMFDNGVPNHGHLVRYENPQSPNAGRVLVCGDSFSVNLVPWLSLAYREVLYAYTAGSVDTKLIESFRPDRLISQTNTRFLVKASVVGVDLDVSARAKIDKMPPDKLLKLKARIAAYPASHWRTWTLGLIADSEARASIKR